MKLGVRLALLNILKTRRRADSWKKKKKKKKKKKWHVRPVKTQISLSIRPVWSVFAVRMKKAWVRSYPLSAQRRLWSDWADGIVEHFKDKEESRLMKKKKKWHVRPAKTQISLSIRPVWSVFAVRMKKAWVRSYPLSAQRRLWSDWADAQAIWVFAGRTATLLFLSWGGSNTNV